MSTIHNNAHDDLLKKCSTQESSISNLKEIVKNKDAELAALKEALKEKNNQKSITLNVHNNKAEMFKLKPTSRSAKAINVTEYKCEYQGCNDIGVYTMKCNGCNKWICDSCHPAQIGKLKPAICKSGSVAIYVLCNTSSV